jgi:hypothetical protein
VNVRELIDRLNQAALELPGGLESTVLVHLCKGREEAGVLTNEVKVVTGEEGAAADCLIVEGHPHAGDENVEQRPMAMGVDAELARLTSGDPLPRAGITVAIGDTGEGFRPIRRRWQADPSRLPRGRGRGLYLRPRQERPWARGALYGR